MIKLSTSFTGVISTGSYENTRPSFLIEEEIGKELTDEQKKQRLEELYGICYGMFKKAEEQSIIERIKKLRADIRFYLDDGIQRPSVTSIIGWDEDFFLKNPEEMLQYAAQGQINHYILHYYITSKIFKNPKEIPEALKYVRILEKGNLKLSPYSGDMPSLFENYPINFTESEKTVINKEDNYAGTLDAIGIPTPNKNWDKIGIAYQNTIFDLKRTASPEKNFKQMSAYAVASGLDIKQMVVLVINNKTKQGYSKPIVSSGIKEYYKMFLQDRRDFKKRFGI